MSEKGSPITGALSKVASSVKSEIAEFKTTNTSEITKDGKPVKVVAQPTQQFIDASIQFHLSAASAEVGAALAATVKDML